MAGAAVGDVQALRLAPPKPMSASPPSRPVSPTLSATRPYGEVRQRRDCMLDRVLDLVRDSELACAQQRPAMNGAIWSPYRRRRYRSLRPGRLALADDLDAATALVNDLDADAADALDPLTARDPATQEGGGGE